MLWSGSTAVMAALGLLATMSPTAAFSLPWLTEEPENSARNFQPQVEQGVYLNTFSSALLNLLSSLNMVQMTNRYPVNSNGPQHQQRAEAKLGGIGIVIPDGGGVGVGVPSGSLTVSKNVTYGTVGIGLPAGGLTGGLAATIALCAAIGAGLAALIAFVIPPLQIANQILAIIAIALLVAYIIEDKHYKPKEYKDYDDSGLYSVYEYTGNYASNGYASNGGYGSDGYDGYSSGYDRYDEEDSSDSYATEKTNKYGSPYSPPVKTAHDYSSLKEKTASTTPDGKPDPYAAVYPYTQRKGEDFLAAGASDSDEQSNMIASGEERRSIVPPTVLNGIGRIATAAIVGLGSIYDEKD